MHQANPTEIYPALTRQGPSNPNPAIGLKPCYTSVPKCSYFVPGSSRSYFKMQLLHLTFLPGSQIFTKLNSCLARDKTSSWSPWTNSQTWKVFGSKIFGLQKALKQTEEGMSGFKKENYWNGLSSSGFDFLILKCEMGWKSKREKNEKFCFALCCTALRQPWVNPINSKYCKTTEKMTFLL